jgi:hypothetical protein|tara:strand:+ start:1118 stop:1336 length:219 start_codon:yes stop_codon:yes gene_type:complete
MSMNKEQNMALLDIAFENSPTFVYFLKGWMGVDHHEEMAKAARSELSHTEEGKNLLAEFDAKHLDTSTASEV